MEMIFECFEYVTRVASEVFSSESGLAVFALIISVLSATIAGLACWFTRTSLHRQVLADLHKAYSSPEMHLAVEALWALRRKHEEVCEKKYKDLSEGDLPDKVSEELVNGYKNARNRDKRKFQQDLSEDPQRALDFHKNTLRYHRRLVSHFYQHLATLYVNRMLPQKYIYDNWYEADLRIIPHVIIPIENWLRKELHRATEPELKQQHPLWRLYNDAPPSS